MGSQCCLEVKVVWDLSVGHQLDISWTTVGHQLDISWTSVGHQLDISWTSDGHQCCRCPCRLALMSVEDWIYARPPNLLKVARLQICGRHVEGSGLSCASTKESFVNPADLVLSLLGHPVGCPSNCCLGPVITSVQVREEEHSCSW